MPTGWLTGRLRDKQGLFPESYVTLINEESSSLDSTVPEILACDLDVRYSNLGDLSTRYTMPVNPQNLSFYPIYCEW